MKIIKSLAIAGLLICAGNLTAQNLETLKNYEFEEKPDYFKHDEPNEQMVGVKDKVISNFEYNNSDQLVEYYLEHRAMILNSDEMIEAYNKLYIPLSSANSKLLEMKARVIKKNGEIINLDDSKILTSKDEETNREYKYYAYEGVEIGSIIEYFYLLERLPSYTGDRHTFQDDYDKYNIEFDLYSPNNLVFKFKSYNQLAEVVLDTNEKDYLHWNLNVDTLKKLEEEAESAVRANERFLIYKLDRNDYAKKYNLSSYSTIAKTMYSYYYTELSKTEKKVIDKIIKESNCKTARDKAAKIRAIEDYLKMTIYIADFESPELSDVSKILTNKVASRQGVMKLYIAIFNALEINQQIVLTCDRFSLKFDQDFEAYNFLSKYLIYFPDLKTFLSPDDISSRLGYPPSELTNNYGLFIKEIEIGELKTALASIKFIPPIDYEKSFDQILTEITLDENDIYNSVVKMDRSTGGYYAMNIQPFMNLFKEENKNEVIDEYIKFIGDDITISNKKVFYDDAKYFGIEPFQVVAEFNLNSFIENAGNNYILKVGDLIGPQVEMYQEKERVLPIESRFKRNYHRVIKITVPEKFKIKNLDDLTIENEYKDDDGTVLMSFKSFYTMEGNVLSITADEYYDMIEIGPELYNTYRKVINSAADFNKVSLILE